MQYCESNSDCYADESSCKYLDNELEPSIGFTRCASCQHKRMCFVDVRIIRITPCVFDEMHTGALFRVFSKSCFFLRDSQNPTTNLPPKCIWGSFVVVLMYTTALFKRQT
jgi:hypothetical protein